jgi:hypothetical protein
MTDQHQSASWRQLVNESITPDEERAWLTWWASRSSQKARDMREHAEAQSTGYASTSPTCCGGIPKSP